MEALLKEYLKSRERDCTFETIARFQYQLNSVKVYLKRHHRLSDWGEVQSDHLHSFIEWKRQAVKRNTLDSFIWVIKAFLRWLHEEGYHLAEIVFATDFKASAYYPRFTPSQWLTKEVLEVCQKGSYPNRARAILELVYSTGLRLGEVQSLNLSDIKGEYLRVWGKGNKERVVPVGKEALKWLDIYIKGERKECSKNPLEQALFLSRYGRHLQRGSYRTIIPKELHPNLTLHGLRHACATHMLENGANILSLQKLLGHNSLDTTAIYTKVDVSNLKEMLHKFHPKC